MANVERSDTLAAKRRNAERTAMLIARRGKKTEALRHRPLSPRIKLAELNEMVARHKAAALKENAPADLSW